MIGNISGRFSKDWKLHVGLALIAMTVATGLASAADFYVALDGNDTWTGTKTASAVAVGDGPFRTIHRAAAAVREMRKAQPDRATPIVVQIRGGTHFLDRPLVLGPEDSGTAGSPVVYEAFPGEEPVLSGGQPITGWKETGTGRWEVTIPEVTNGWAFAQLYVNDQRRLRPVWPKNGYFSVAGKLEPTKPGNPDRFVYPEGSFDAGWRNPSDIEVTTFHKWTMDRLRIASVDSAQWIVTFTGPTHSADQAPLDRGTWFHVENVFEKLDEPGEWYLDRPAGVLTYLARPGEQLADARVIAPRLSQIVRLEGDPENGRYVEHVFFRGLTFAHTAWTTPDRGYGYPQADVAVDAAIAARYAKDCVLERCVVRHTGNWAVEWGEGCHGNRVESCELFDLGAGGVKVGSTQIGQEPDTNKWASGCVVRDCLIAHGGRVLPGAGGVWIGHASSNLVANNHVVDFYYSGISVGWSWNPGFSPAHDNTIVSNHIHDIGQGVLSDMGGIYTLGESPGTTLKYNRIHDVTRARYGGFGIYFDQSSAGILVERNLVYRTRDAGLHHNYGAGNTVRNNIFAFGSNGQLRFNDVEQSGAMLIEQNIFYWSGAKLPEDDNMDDEIVFRSNLYWRTDGEAILFPKGATFSDWQAREPGARVADPLFADPLKDDFRLRRDSPASAIGFVPFDLSGAGRVTRKDRTASLPVPPRVFPPAPTENAGKTFVLDEDFEAYAPGQTLLGLDTYEGVGGSARVITGSAAGGSQSLRLVDSGPGKDVFTPHLYTYNVRYESGVIRGSFAVRTKPGSHVNVEWRDYSLSGDHYITGPAVDILPDGMLRASGRGLMRLRQGPWYRIEIECGLGGRRTRNYTLRVCPAAEGKARVFDDLPLSGEFRVMTWIGFSSYGTPSSTYYLDDLMLRCDGP